MDNGSVQRLSIAPGLRNLLEQHGLFTIKSVANQSQGEIAVLLGIDTYVAGIIIQAAKKSLKDTEHNMENTAAAVISTVH
jgi:hypothetical protein